MLLWMMWDDTVMDENLVEEKKLHLEDFNAKTSRYLWDVKRSWAQIRWSTRIYLTQVFQEASLQNQIWKERTISTQNTTYFSI